MDIRSVSINAKQKESSLSLKNSFSSSTMTTTFTIASTEITVKGSRPPFELSELLGRISPNGFLKKQEKGDFTIKPGWGRLSVPLSIMYKNLYSLASLREEVIHFDSSVHESSGDALGKFARYAIVHPWQALKKTMPPLKWYSPNSWISWFLTSAEVGVKTCAAILTKPLRWFNKKVTNPKESKVMRAIKGIGLAIPAGIGWLLSQPLNLMGNVFSYTRHIIDGVSTLVTLPFKSRKDKAAIAKVAGKSILRNTALLVPAAALLAVSIIPGAQIIPAAASIAWPAFMGLSAAAQGAAAVIEYGAREVMDAPKIRPELLSSTLPSQVHASKRIPRLNSYPSSRLPSQESTKNGQDLYVSVLKEGEHRLSESKILSQNANSLWNESKRKTSEDHALYKRCLTVVNIPKAANPLFVLTQGVSPELAQSIAKGIKSLSTQGKTITEENLILYVNHDKSLAAHLYQIYLKSFTQSFVDPSTKQIYLFPSDIMLDFAESIVKKFLDKGKKVFYVPFAWDRQSIEAVMLCATLRDCECKNNSVYPVPPFSKEQLSAFKCLLNAKSRIDKVRFEEIKPQFQL
jgi:hypothetical protein